MHQGVTTPNPGPAVPSSLGHNLLLLAFIFTSYPTFLSPFGALGPWWDLSWPMAAPAAPATVVVVTVSANEKEELEEKKHDISGSSSTATNRRCVDSGQGSGTDEPELSPVSQSILNPEAINFLRDPKFGFSVFFCLFTMLSDERR